MPRPMTTVLWLSLCAPLFVGCASRPIEIAPKVLAPPETLLACATEPIPPTQPTQLAVARYIVDLAWAGRDCRDRLDAVRGWVGEMLGHGPLLAPGA